MAITREALDTYDITDVVQGNALKVSNAYDITDVVQGNALKVLLHGYAPAQGGWTKTAEKIMFHTVHANKFPLNLIRTWVL